MQCDRYWSIPSHGIYHHDEPGRPRDASWSFRWQCAHCGQALAELRSYQDGQLQPYRFISAICIDCSARGHRFHVPGSIERFELLTWDVPKPLLDYQLSIELDFLHHPEHPHNKEPAA